MTALQFAEKLAIRIRVSLQRYHKCRRISLRLQPLTEISNRERVFPHLFGHAIQNCEGCGLQPLIGFPPKSTMNLDPNFVFG